MARALGPARLFRSAEALLEREAPNTVVLLHGLRFAPNAGASLRAAHLLGAQAVIFIGGVAEKADQDLAPLQEALRISMAARHGWRLHLCAHPKAEAQKVIDACRAFGCSNVCVETDTAGLSSPPAALDSADLAREKAAFLFGAEDTGVPLELMKACDDFVSIPTLGKGSLNVSHAVALVLYERGRQIRQKNIQPA
ncbi:unnamed protein product [Effrenium voratum]|nr:unnamed protein product [Effrenium voratum]